MGEISGKLCNIDIQNNKLRLWIQFYLDGQIMETGKPGNYDYAYLPVIDIVNKTHVEIKQCIMDFISRRSKRRVMVEYHKNCVNPDWEIETSMAQDILSNVIDLVDLKKINVAETEAEILVDSERTGFFDKKYVVTTDSLINVEDIIPVPTEKI